MHFHQIGWKVLENEKVEQTIVQPIVIRKWRKTSPKPNLNPKTRTLTLILTIVFDRFFAAFRFWHYRSVSLFLSVRSLASHKKWWVTKTNMLGYVSVNWWTKHFFACPRGARDRRGGANLNFSVKSALWFLWSHMCSCRWVIIKENDGRLFRNSNFGGWPPMALVDVIGDRPSPMKPMVAMPHMHRFAQSILHN